MLPGFRFLFAAIVLSISVLVFGLGAAALLRAAHEQFASIPARQAPREPVFAQQEAPAPTLALLRVEPTAAETAPAELPASSEPVAPVTADTTTPPAADTPAPAEPEKLAALKPDESPPAEVAKPNSPTVEAPALETTEATPTSVETTPTVEAAPAPAEAPVPAADVKIAAIPDAPTTTNEAAPASPAPTEAQASPETAEAATKIATLGGPAITVGNRIAAKADAKSAAGAISKRARAQRAKRHRLAAQRARLARQAAVAQQPANPFAPPQPAVTRRAP
jgi:hypothetical protein